MQRRRWVLGSLQNIDKFPLIHKFKMMFKLVTYFLGFVSGVTSTILYIHTQVPKLLLLSTSISEINQTINFNVMPWFDKLLSLFSPESMIYTLTNGSPIDIGVGLMVRYSHPLCGYYRIR